MLNPAVAILCHNDKPTYQKEKCHNDKPFYLFIYLFFTLSKFNVIFKLEKVTKNGVNVKSNSSSSALLYRTDGKHV